MNKNQLSLSIEDFITGSGGGKNKQRTPVEAPNTLQSRATIKVVEVLSEGEIMGLVGGLKGVYLDETPIQNTTGSFNFPAVVYEERTGTPGQDHIPGFSGSESALFVNTEVEDMTGVVRSVSGNTVDAVRVLIRLPQGLTKMDTKSGDLNGHRVGLAIDTRPTGGTWTPVFGKTITGKAVTPYEEAYRVEKPAGISTAWEVRVRRTTAKANLTTVSDRLDWFAMSEIQDVKVAYENAAVVGLAFDAESTGGNVPRRSYLIDGLIIKVPTNYTPTVYNADGSVLSYATISGTWNGTFKDSWCDDPAWILYDLLTNERYGMGEYIDTSNIDIYSFYEASKYNCELIDDGTDTDTMEPRFRCNVPIQSREDAFKILQSIAATFRAAIFSGPGYLKLIQDRPSAPVATMTNSNVIDGQFIYTGTELSSRVTAVDVTFNDAKNRYLPSTITEEAAPEILSAYGFNKVELSAIGVIGEGQARRIGKWVIDNTTSATEGVTFKVSWSNAFVEVGDVVNIADNWYAAEQFSGLVKAGGSGVNQIKLDRPVTVTNGQTIKFMTFSGVEHTRTITNTGTTDTLTLAAVGGSVDPSLYAGVPYTILGEVAPRQFKIVSVKEASPGIYDLTAVVHDPSKYARVEQGIYVAPPTFTQINASAVDAPENVTVNPETYLDANGGVKFRLRFNWDDVDNVLLRGYKIRHRRNNNAYVWTDLIPQSEYILPNIEEGIYEYTVHAYNTLNIQSPGTDGYYQFTLGGVDASPIAAPTGLLLAAGGTSWTGAKFDITWVAPAEVTTATAKDYQIQILDGSTVVKTIYQTANTLTIANTDVIAWAGRAMRSIKVKVSVRDTLLRFSLPVETTFTNAAPAVPLNPVLGSQWQYYILNHDAPVGADVAGIRIHHSLTAGFTPSLSNFVKNDSGVQHFVEATPDKTYYVKFAAYDTWGVDDLNYSTDYSIYTQSEDGLANEIQDRIDADADAAAELAAAIAAEAAARAADLEAEAADRAAAIAAEVLARTDAIAAEATARSAAISVEAADRADALIDLAATLGTAITNETTLRESADDSLAATIATLTAGAGEQFDSRVIWYFDSALESWTGNGTPTINGGYLRAANDLSNPYLHSPTGLGINTASYRYVKARIKRTGTPTWEGSLKWRNPADGASAWNGPFVIGEPTFDENGIATIDFKAVTWSGTIDQIRLELSSVQSGSDYFEIDWVAIGRPSPGASTAALEEERQARITGDSAEASQRTTLATQVRGGYTGTDPNALSTGLLYNERVARATADSAMASNITALQSTVNNGSTGVAATAAAVTALTTRVTNAEGVNSSQAAALTTLQSTVNNASTGVTATATGLNTLTTRVTSAEGSISTLSDSLTSLTSTVNNPTTGVAANASALSGLSTRVTTAEGTLSTLSTSVTSLSSTLNGKTTTFAQPAAPSTTGRVVGDLWIDTDDSNKIYTWDGSAWAIRPFAASNKVWAQPSQPSLVGNIVNDLWFDTDDNNKMYRWTGTAWSLADDGRISATATALTTLTTRVTNAENVNTSQSASITTLQNTVDDPSTGVTATASGLSSLTTRVTAAEGVNTSQGSAITTLQNTVNNASTGVTATASALSALTTRVTSAEGVNTSQSGSITSLQNTVNNPSTGVTATASALSALTTRVTNTENVNTSQGSAITTLQNTVNNASTGVTATASALSALTTRVTSAEGVNTSQASSITSLNSTITHPTTGLAATVSAVSTLNTSVSSLTGAVNAQYTLRLDANGYVSGFQSTNNGITATFDILADKFRIVTPGQTPKVPFAVSANQVQINTDLYMGNGKIIAQAGGFMKVQGVGFGTSNQFIEWFGPVMAINACAENNAVSYEKIDGTAYFGGIGYSGSDGTIKLDNGEWTTGDGMNPSRCTVEIGNTGVLSVLENDSFTTARPANSWMTPVNATLASTYEVYVQPTVGTFSSNSGINTWLPLNTTRSYSVFKGNVGTGVKSCTFVVSIRKAGTPTVLDSATYKISAYGGADSPPTCVLVGSYLPDGRKAGDIVVGDTMMLADHVSLEDTTGTVSRSDIAFQRSYRIVTESGVALGCSATAPIPTIDGSFKIPMQLLGEKVPVMVKGEKRWEEVVTVTDLGQQLVQHITVENACFWAGETEDAYILHHNIKYQIP